jgi:hypothetical protein
MGTLLRLLITGAALAVVYIALREPDAPPRTRRLREPRGGAFDEPEPVLGFDGMDLDTLIPWLEAADLDEATLERIREYEQRHRARETVLDTLEDLLG